MIGVQDGKISYIGDKNKESSSAKKTYHFKNHLLSPGFVNTHTHLPMSLFRGLVDNVPLKTWLNDYIFPLEAEFVNEDFVAVGTELSLVELIRTGVTTFCDMYFYNQVMAEVVDQAGLRAILGVGFPNLDKGFQDWKKETLQLKNNYKNHSCIQVGVAPHAPYSVEAKVLEEMGSLSKSEDLNLIIHVSESLWEQQEIKKKYNKTPVAHLHSLGVTGKKSLFVHCVHVNQEDLQLMKETGTSFSYNPESNMKLSNGVAPVTEAVRKGVVVGLGTDSSASNNDLNFFGEMDMGSKIQSIKYGDQSLKAQEMFHMATLGGAEALNLEQEIGSLEEGKRADIIAIDSKSSPFLPSLQPCFPFGVQC